MLNFKVVQTIIAMLTEDKVTEISYMADEFCKFFDLMAKKYAIEVCSKRKYHRDGTLSTAEVMRTQGALKEEQRNTKGGARSTKGGVKEH